MNQVTFIDTTVLCNLIPVPGRDQNRDAVRAEMGARLEGGEQFILPITAVIETGNFVAQIGDGGQRRACADILAGMLRLVCEGRAPWVLHDVEWSRAFLETFLAGADTGTTFVDHAMQGLGAGDLCILAERAAYRERTRLEVGIWTLDHGLAAYA